MLRAPLRAFATTVALAVPLASGPAHAQGYLCAEGGGNASQGDWAPSVFGWITGELPGADVVVIGTSGGDPNTQAAFLAAGASSAVGMAVNAGNADQQATYDAIAAADVVWMRGGDQWQYVLQWRGTLAEQALLDVYQAGGCVGGSSAGCAVLGSAIYDARNGGVYPDEMLEDPYNVYATFTDDFLGFLPGAIFDTHFTERGRLPRLAGFLGRRYEDADEDLLGIGVDDRTALCVYPDGSAVVRGEGAVTLLHRRAETQQRIEPGRPPFQSPLAHTQLTEGYVYDLASRAVVTRPTNAAWVGPPGDDPVFANFELSGSSAGDASVGETRVVDGGDDLALFLGALTFPAGSGLLSTGVVTTRVWNGTAFDENRVGGPQYALALDPHGFALYLDGGVRVRASASGYLTGLAPSGGIETSVCLLDTHGIVSVAFSTYTSDPQSVGPRQSCALEGATLHVLHAGQTFDADAHEVMGGVPYGTGKTNSLGLEPRLSWDGSPSAEVDTFELRVADGVPNQPALLFDGPAAASAPFQGGTLYVGAPFTRLGVRTFDATGAAAWPRPVEPGRVGDTRYHQVWYRDPQLGDGYDVGLTNGLEVRFRS